MYDLFEDLSDPNSRDIELAEGALLSPGFAKDRVDALLVALQHILVQSPLRQLTTPGGYKMSVASSNCGQLGWVSDLSGYRYEPIDPTTGKAWPPLPSEFLDLAKKAAARAGYKSFIPDACLINCYQPGARLSLHQDKDEQDTKAPIVSVSLGLPAIFLFGGLKREQRPKHYRLEHGDILAWGGVSRFAYHGIAPIADGYHSQLGRQRISMTFRKVY